MDLVEEMKEVHDAVMDDDWNFMIKYFKKRPEHLLFPMNLSRDSAFHFAVYSKKEKPFKDLLKIAIDSGEYKDALLDVMLSANSSENTILHEAATVGNLDVIRLLLCGDQSSNLQEDCKERLKEQLMAENLIGEVPLFTAAAFGQTEIVEFLVGQEGQMREGKISDVCRKRFDGKSILQIAIEGEHFDTALLLLKYDESLAQIADESGMTAFHYLANMPTSFRSGCPIRNIFDQFLYFWLPVYEHVVEDKNSQASNRHINSQVSGHSAHDHDAEDKNSKKDLEIGQLNNPDSRSELKFNRTKPRIHKFIEGWPKVGRIWEQKIKHKYASKLAKKLAEMTITWKEFYQVQFNVGGKPFTNLQTPLFIATENGIMEIVEEILHKNPQSVGYENTEGQNILHLAVIHRRKEIFDLLKEMKMAWVRISRKIDNEGATLLHRAADTSCYSGGTRPGPALQLQEELLWFERVERAVPSHYAMLRVKKSSIEKVEENGGGGANSKKVTPIELFKEKHQTQLKDAQEWIKGTSQSCSTVAVLVATVVFAAAYTVPGGTNERGFPIFLRSPFFQFFTVMDVVSLACSLTSVVAFLSILTSPFEFDDFRRSIPRKLSFGFTLLFFSVITTMLAFGATILLIIRSDRNWTTSLISFAAFLPVSVFVLLQFRLYWTFIEDAFGAFKKILLWFPSPKRKLD